MELNKLFLFSKNTDAFASQRGYNYQTLKTLETWIYNFLEDSKDDIYCEFEEDIFQKNDLEQKLTFRQIKLYSSNFSFSSEEIKKCICHFFNLHIKFNYLDFSKEYVFETNSNIAHKHLNNDAELLREWFECQNDLDNDSICKYSKKVKEIITEYIDVQRKKYKGEKSFKEALAVFEKLESKFWEEFTKMIKWKFIGSTPEEEFTSIRNNIEILIRRLPYEIARNNSLNVFGVLLDTVFKIINKEQNEERKLTYDILEKALLSIGNNEDVWYSNRYNFYKTIPVIDSFRIGEYFEILDLVNYCRRKKYLHKHKSIWNPFLLYYSRQAQISSLFKKKAIYEIVFLNNEFYEVDYENLATRERPDGSLIGFEQDIRYYFNDFKDFKTTQDIEKAQIIIKLVIVASIKGKSLIKEKELMKWFLSLYKIVYRKLFTENDINEKCSLLELKGTFLLHINRNRQKSKFDSIKCFDEIVSLVKVNHVQQFKLSQFGDRIEKYIKIQLNVDPEDTLGKIEALETFLESLFPLLEQREGKIKLAQSLVKRGFDYLKTSIPKNLLKALDNFHKAKDHYFQQDTLEGFVLALLNIASLYNSIGMHFAAKNYALAAFRISTNNQLIKKIEDSLSLIAYSDYLQGSWFNALSIYKIYIRLRLNSNFDKSDVDAEESATINIAFMLLVMEKSSSQFKNLIENYISDLDYFGDEIVIPIQTKWKEELIDDKDYSNAIECQIEDFPLNDFGSTRTISFHALGSLWRINFYNDHSFRSIAEEYIASIQIILSEIALSNVDFHLLKSTIEIDLVVSEKYIHPEQIPSNEVIKWKVYLCFCDSIDHLKINHHSAHNMISFQLILNNISVLKSSEFKELFLSFFTESKLSSKQISVNLYQKIHRDIYIEGDFYPSYALSFKKKHFKLNFPKENTIMVWDNSLSAKYNKLFNLEAIKNRLNNIKKSTYYTLTQLNNNPDFRIWLNSLRNQGLKDWQILMNIQNIMVNYKVQRFEKIKAQTDKEYLVQAKSAFWKYMEMDELDCYVEFPLEAFKKIDFIDQFNRGLSSILPTYGLESKLITPNFGALKDFLEIRFNMKIDDYNENNPLKDIY